MVDLVQRFIAVTVAVMLCFSCFWCCFLTQDFGSLVGSLRQRPVRCAVVSSQFDVQLTSERLVLPPRDQPATLKQQQTETWRHSTSFTPHSKHFSLLEKHIMKQIYLKMYNHHGHQRDYWSHSPGWRCRQRPAPQCSEAQPGPACWTRCSWCRRGSRGLRRLSACWGEECCRPRRPTDLWFDRDTKSNINSLP